MTVSAASRTSSGITETLTSMAAAQVADGQHQGALDLAQRAAENADLHDQPELRWDAETLVGIALRRLHRTDEARKALTDAVRSIELLSTEVTVSDALLVLPLRVPVTTWFPAVVAVQVAPVQLPSGAIENAVCEVTSPSEVPSASKPSAV